MSKIKIDNTKCVRYFSNNSTCTKCIDICPQKALVFDDIGLGVKTNICTACGACNSICPNEAFTYANLSPTKDALEIIKTSQTSLSCFGQTKCLAIYGTEHFVAFASQIGDISINLSDCATCKNGALYDYILANANSANDILSTFSTNKIQPITNQPQTQNDTNKPSPNRRDFFKTLSLKNTIAIKTKLESIDTNQIEYAGIDEKDSTNRPKNILCDRRKFFTIAVKNKETKHKVFKDGELEFISNKSILDSCDNCSLCYRICPTKALDSTTNNQSIVFDISLCVKCHLCHDVCHNQSIIGVDFEISEFAKNQKRILKTFNIKRCDECSNIFTSLNNETICPRCKNEEEESKSLWNI